MTNNELPGEKCNCPRPAITGVLLLLLVLTSACRPDQPDGSRAGGKSTANRAGDATPVATVGSSVITVDDFAKAMIDRGGALTGAFRDERNKEKLLDEMIRFEVMAEKAGEGGYFERPDIIRVMKKMAVEAFERDRLNAAAVSNSLTDADFEDFYAAHTQEFAVPERAHVALILVRVPPKATEEKKKELMALAEQIRLEALALDPGVKHFGGLAAKHSDDQSSRYKGGDIGWVSRGVPHYRMESNVVEAIFALSQPGALSQVTVSPSGYHLLKLIDRQAPGMVPLSAVRDNVRLRIERSRRVDALDKIYKELRKDVKVVQDMDLLKTVPPPRRVAEPVEKGPPSLPKE